MRPGAVVALVLFAPAVLVAGCDYLASAPPFAYLGVFVESADAPPLDPTTSLVFGLRNTSTRTIARASFRLFLYDEDGVALTRGAVAFDQELNLPAGAEVEVRQSLDDLLFYRLAEPPLVDGFALHHLVWDDGETWTDLLELYAYPHDVAPREVVP